MEKQTIVQIWDALRRAFAMMSLAMVSDWPRERLFKRASVKISVDGVMKEVLEEVPKLTSNVPSNMRAVRMPHDIGEKLRRRVARGDVTTIVPHPEPFTWIVITSGHEELRTIYGIWVGRAASWRGKVDPDKLPHLGAMTVQEAEAKGIPIPNFGKE